LFRSSVRGPVNLVGRARLGYRSVVLTNVHRFAALLAGVVAVLAFAPRATAGSAEIDVERYTPQMDGRGLFTLESAETHHAGQWSVGLVLHYGRRPLVVRDEDGHVLDLVAHRLTGNIVASFGVWRRLTLQAALPVALVNDAAPALRGTTALSGLGTARLAGKLQLLQEGTNGVGLSLHVALGLPTGNPNAFLSQNGVVFAPSLLVEKHAGIVRVAGRLAYVARPPARYRDLTLDDEILFAAALGLFVHQRVEIGTEFLGATAASSPFGSRSSGNALEWIFGARVFASDTWQLQLGGGRGLSPGAGTPRFRFFAGLVWGPHRLDSDGDGVPDDLDQCTLVRGDAANSGCPWPDADNDGVLDNVDDCPNVAGPRENRGCPYTDADGDGVLDKDDACPNVRGPRENRGCPYTDTDGDGVLDKDDPCPNVAGPRENRGCPWPDTDNDGVLDKDDPCPNVAGPRENRGCPWPDTDGDGVLDKDDACPNVRGPRENRGCPYTDTDGDGIPDKDDACPNAPGPRQRAGCPRVVVTKTEVRIDGQILFRSGSAEILRDSFDLLDGVAKVLREVPRIRKVEIQGHTDDLGGKKVNRRLSQRRAEAVRRYLTEKGIASERLDARGYGADEPVVRIDKRRMSKRQLAEARAKNRRVQFIIREQ
jgi:outer membrane protein OmpA-like peptidoglycan-associated protein